jgi:hypothetical protein
MHIFVSLGALLYCFTGFDVKHVRWTEPWSRFEFILLRAHEVSGVPLALDLNPCSFSL